MQPGRACWKEGYMLQLLSPKQLACEDKEKLQTCQLNSFLQGTRLEMIMAEIRATDTSGTCLKKKVFKRKLPQEKKSFGYFSSENNIRA